MRRIAVVPGVLPSKKGAGRTLGDRWEVRAVYLAGLVVLTCRFANNAGDHSSFYVGFPKACVGALS